MSATAAILTVTHSFDAICILLDCGAFFIPQRLRLAKDLWLEDMMFGLCVTRSVSALDTTGYHKCFERYVHIISNPKYADMSQAVSITQGRRCHHQVVKGLKRAVEQSYSEMHVVCASNVLCVDEVVGVCEGDKRSRTPAVD
jgi:hypothetical protein